MIACSSVHTAVASPQQDCRRACVDEHINNGRIFIINPDKRAHYHRGGGQSPAQVGESGQFIGRLKFRLTLHHWLFALKIVVTCALLIWVLRNASLTSLSNLILGADLWLIVAGVLVLFSILLPATVRWQLVLRSLSTRLSYNMLFTWMVAASFFNQVLPSTMGGDVFRAHWCRRAAIKLSTALSSILIDRLCALISGILLCLLSIPLLIELLEGRELLMALAAPVAGVAGLFLLLIARYLSQSRFTIIRTVATFSAQLYSTLFSLRTGMWIIIAGLITHLVRIVGIWILSDALQLDIHLLTCLALVPICLLLSMVPISLGGWGVRESVFVVAFGYAGVSATDALALSVVFGFASIVAALPGALVWLGLGDAK